jgi:hypothetical protein
MKQSSVVLLFAALALAAASAADARDRISVVIDPFAFVVPAPPVIYQPAPIYVPPPVVYVGGGSWGGDRGGERRDHRRGRDDDHRHR